MKLRIGVISATAWEIAPWLRLSRSKRFLTWEGGIPVYRALFPQGEVFTVVSGIGTLAAQKAASALLDTQSPTLVVSAGFAGALREDLSIGDIVVEGRSEGLDIAAMPLGRPGRPVRVGQVATSRSVLETPEKKRVFARDTGAAVVEMEWQGVQAACRRHGVIPAAVKVVSDRLSETIPLPRGLIRHTGSLSIGRVVRGLLGDPLSIPRTIRFGLRTPRLSKRLAGFLGEFVALAWPVLERRSRRFFFDIPVKASRS